jgi:hypothetical protein
MVVIAFISAKADAARLENELPNPCGAHKELNPSALGTVKP